MFQKDVPRGDPSGVRSFTHFKGEIFNAKSLKETLLYMHCLQKICLQSNPGVSEISLGRAYFVYTQLNSRHVLLMPAGFDKIRV